MNFAERLKTEQNDAKTVEIKRGDLLDITMDLMREDESTAVLAKRSPLMIPVFMIFAKKIEGRLFGEEE